MEFWSSKTKFSLQILMLIMDKAFTFFYLCVSMPLRFENNSESPQQQKNGN